MDETDILKLCHQMFSRKLPRRWPPCQTSIIQHTARRCPHKARAKDQTTLKLVTCRVTNISIRELIQFVDLKGLRINRWNYRTILTPRCSCDDGVFFCICFLSRCCASLVGVSFCSPFSPPDSPLSARESAIVFVSSDKTNRIQIHNF